MSQEIETLILWLAEQEVACPCEQPVKPWPLPDEASCCGPCRIRHADYKPIHGVDCQNCQGTGTVLRFKGLRRECPNGNPTFHKNFYCDSCLGSSWLPVPALEAAGLLMEAPEFRYLKRGIDNTYWVAGWLSKNPAHLFTGHHTDWRMAVLLAAKQYVEAEINNKEVHNGA